MNLKELLPDGISPKQFQHCVKMTFDGISKGDESTKIAESLKQYLDEADIKLEDIALVIEKLREELSLQVADHVIITNKSGIDPRRRN